MFNLFDSKIAYSSYSASDISSNIFLHLLLFSLHLIHMHQASYFHPPSFILF